MTLPFIAEDGSCSTFALDLSPAGRKVRVTEPEARAIEFAVPAGKAAYIVEPGSKARFRKAPPHPQLRVNPGKAFALELEVRIVRGNPAVTLYLLQYDARGKRIGHILAAHKSGWCRGTVVPHDSARRVGLAIRLAGRGAVEFGSLRVSAAPHARTVVAVPKHDAALKPLRGQRLRAIGSRLLRPGLAPWRNKAGDMPAYRGARDLKALNDRLPDSSASRWLVRALTFAVQHECYETAERLANYAWTAWPSLPAEDRRALVLPLLDAFAAVGDETAARETVALAAPVFGGNDRFTVYRRMFQPAADESFLLPSGKVDAFSLFRAPQHGRTEIMRLHKRDPRLFTDDPQNRLLLCNAAAGAFAAPYRRELNACLAKFRAGEIESLAFDANVLATLRFRPGKPIANGPKVSVVMAARNAEATVGYAMRSILEQDYRNIELLVCDDASSDGTFAAIQAAAGDGRVRVFRSQSAQGPYNVRNALIGLAQGQFIAFQDADDFAFPARIALQMTVLRRTKALACVARWIRILPGGAFVFFRDQSAIRNSLVSILAPKTVFERFGPYRPLSFGADTEFKERIRKSAGDAAVHQMHVPLLFGLWSEASLTRSSGAESREDGYRGPLRRRLAEITTRQRLLGPEAVPEEGLIAALAQQGIAQAPSAVAAAERG